MRKPPKGKGKSGEPLQFGGGFLSALQKSLGGDLDVDERDRQFQDEIDKLQAVAKDPLGILGHPLPTPAERKTVEALAKQLNRPPKLCRRALMKSNYDRAGATKLLNDPDFCRRHIEFDPAVMGRFRNPYEGQQYYLRQEATYLGRSEKDIAPKLAKLQKQAEQYDKQRQQARQKGQRPSKLKDPVLGNLTWKDLAWEGRVVVPGFGRLPLTVETDHFDPRQPPSEKHQTALKKLIASGSSLRKKVEQANFKYLQRVRKNYEDSDMPVPKVSSPEKLWRYLRSPALIIPLQRGKSWRVELTWNCTWDEEHGHLVGIRDGKVVHVGLQGEGW
jgi:hypothetical protein